MLVSAGMRDHVQEQQETIGMPSPKNKEDRELDEEGKGCVLGGGTPCQWEKDGGMDKIKEKYDQERSSLSNMVV